MTYINMHFALLHVQLVDGPFDLKEKFLIKEPNVVLLLLELLPNLSEPLQVRRDLYESRRHRGGTGWGVCAINVLRTKVVSVVIHLYVL